MRIAIGIPTYGRQAIVLETVAELGRLSRPADRIIVCYARDEDLPPPDRRPPSVEWLRSEAGLCRQRNRILSEVGDCDVILFLDDDFLPKPDYLAVIERLFLSRPEVVVATGTVLADGVTGVGLSFAEGRRILAGDPGSTEPLRVRPVANGYGCNMAMRLPVLRKTGLRFDEKLPLYAWQEDVELSCRLAAHGSILRVDGARGVHLGVKAGRSPGLQLGYSQVINPLYIATRVPTYTMRRAVRQIGRNLAANMLYAMRPEPWVDRRGRLHGNLIGLMDAVRGRLSPERILALGAAARRVATPSQGLAPARADRGAGHRAVVSASGARTRFAPASQAHESRPMTYQRVPPS
ncbi:glycosyltransferase family 2 protein [Roseomonas sp. JC162]|uniref:Glycosyltransferase family 2 protein n=1 Tax=Neoroseomonas marina TaxID=1232220 RepID=A0A848EGA7_9PROT|nr:glycosyltransferase [Neoroseomonas marina]NMJ42487.1 glycosyltransferase family 2 protein [Neoroseomonas marina]